MLSEPLKMSSKVKFVLLWETFFKKNFSFNFSPIQKYRFAYKLKNILYIYYVYNCWELSGDILYWAELKCLQLFCRSRCHEFPNGEYLSTKHDASLASVITLNIWSYISLLSPNCCSSRLIYCQRDCKIFSVGWQMCILMIHCASSLMHILLCVFSSWGCTGMSCVIYEPYDSYLSNSTLTHYLGFESGNRQNPVLGSSLMIHSQLYLWFLRWNSIFGTSHK